VVDARGASRCDNRESWGRLGPAMCGSNREEWARLLDFCRARAWPSMACMPRRRPRGAASRLDRVWLVEGAGLRV
jgi:hypothetical protein